MNKILTYLTAFSVSIISTVFTLEYLKNKPIETDIITLSNGNKEVVLYGTTHYAKTKYWEDMDATLNQFEKQGYDIFTEGLGTDKSLKNLMISFYVAEKLNYCIHFNNAELNKTLTTQIDYVKNTNYTKYLNNDLFLEDIVLQLNKKPEKNYICFDNVGVEGLRLYTRYKRLFSTENERNAYIRNRDINLTNHILLSHKQKVAAFYGNIHLKYTVKLLEDVGYKVIKEEKVKAY